MAKREDKKKSAKQQSRTDAVRAAVDQAFQATADQAEGTQKRVQEIADELSSVAGRLREALEGSRPAVASDLDGVREELATLSERVAKLEAAAKPAAPARRAPAARKPAPAKPAGAATKSAPAARSAAAATKPSARAAKPAARKPAAARPATAASKVPAARAAARRSAAAKPAAAKRPAS